MNIKFINTSYSPDRFERVRLQIIQDELYYKKTQLLYAIQNYSQYEKIVAIERFHVGFRERWKIINGHKKIRNLA